jgi:hypothetical protein
MISSQPSTGTSRRPSLGGGFLFVRPLMSVTGQSESSVFFAHGG